VPDKAFGKTLWDFLFYMAFGVVVTSSVAIAGVLLVFCFLIIPSIIGPLFSRRMGVALVIGWVGGASASAIGLAASFAWDLPAGAAMVLAFALALVVACALRALLLVSAAERKARARAIAKAVSTGVLLVIAAAMLWLLLMPRADQPVLEFVDAVSGMHSQRFLTPEEQRMYADAVQSARLRHAQAAQVTLQERDSRWQGEGLSDDAVRRLGTFQQAFNEMARGEDFVLRQLTARARERQRWTEAPVVMAACAMALLLLWRPKRRQRPITLAGLAPPAVEPSRSR
jgi:zinc/manganese transport system permease protein